jgi:hypothetical protein
LLTPAALSAAAISFSEAVFADTFSAADWVAPFDGPAVVGVADTEGVLSLDVVVPPQAAIARTITVAAPTKDSLALAVISPLLVGGRPV